MSVSQRPARRIASRTNFFPTSSNRPTLNLRRFELYQRFKADPKPFLQRGHANDCTGNRQSVCCTV